MRKSYVLIGILLFLAGFSAAEDVNADVASVTGLAPPAVTVTHYDISLRADPDENAMQLGVTLLLQNENVGPADEMQFDLLAREKFYGMRASVERVVRILDGRETPQRFAHSSIKAPEDPSTEGTAKSPKITRVFLSPSLEEGSQAKLLLVYRLTHADPTERNLPYRIIAALPDGSREFCLLSDFTWLPQVLADHGAERELLRKNYFPKQPKPAWRISIASPLAYEHMVPDGRQVSSQALGNERRTRWESRVGGLPQVFIGQSERVEVGDEATSVVLLLRRHEFDPKFVDAWGRSLLRAHRFYSELFGPLEGNRISVAASSAGMGGHGAYLGMFLDQQSFNRRLDDKKASPSGFFDEIAAHELAHSWWAHSVTSYGRGTKFLRESLANYAAWHLGREVFGSDRFQETLAYLFFHRQAGASLFSPEGDSQTLAYRKGPLVLEMLRQEMGGEPFFRALRLFAGRHKESHASFADFVAVCNEASNRDWTPFLYHWCYREGYPVYELAGFASKQNGDTYETSVTIRNSGKGITRCPLELRMGAEVREEAFRVPEGETRTLQFLTASPVEQVVVDPRHESYQGDDAEARLKMLAVKESGWEWIHYWRGLVEFEVGQQADAVQSFSAAVARHEDLFGEGNANPAFYFSRGIAHLKIGSRDEAEQDLRTFLSSLGPSQPRKLDRVTRTLRNAGLLTATTGEQATAQLQELLAAATGEEIQLDSDLAAFSQWWKDHRDSFRLSPSVAALRPGGFQ